MRRLLLSLLLPCLLGFARLALADADPLPPEQAYRVEANLLDEQTIEVRFTIAPGYYLYRNKLAFALNPEKDGLDPAKLPEGQNHEDKYFGKQQIYRDALRLTIPLKTPASGPLTLVVTHQGCADMGVCYPPSEVSLPLVMANMSHAATSAEKAKPAWIASLDKSAPSAAMDVPASPVTTGSAPLPPPPDDGLQQKLSHRNLFLMAASFFGLGLLLCFTPCTLPMVPILSSIIIGHGHKISHQRAAALSVAYVLGMALTYAVAGVAAGFAGQLLSSWLQNAWVLGGFALIFVALALSMFGVYDLQLPAHWQHRLSSSAHQHGGSIPQLAIMGAMSALIVGPCITAPLAGALAYITRTHDALTGGLALFALGLGMGAPLILISVAARHLLPKPGPWMEGINRFFGMVLLGVALYIVSPVLPPILPMFGWAALLIFSGVFLRAFDSLPADAHASYRVFKAIGILLMLAGATILIGALAGSRNPLQPLAGLHTEAPPATPVFARIHNNAELDAQIGASKLPVILDFYADWCVSCREMEDKTFTDSAVATRMAGFTLLRADVTANTPDDRALLKRFGLYAPPGILFFAPGGQEIDSQRVIGFMDAEPFHQHLDAVHP
jgi:thioredoxin:protein disulfide reductase